MPAVVSFHWESVPIFLRKRGFNILPVFISFLTGWLTKEIPGEGINLEYCEEMKSVNRVCRGALFDESYISSFATLFLFRSDRTQN